MFQIFHQMSLSQILSCLTEAFSSFVYYRAGIHRDSHVEKHLGSIFVEGMQADLDINNMQCDQRVALAGLRTEGEIQDKVLTEAGNHQLLQHCLCVQSLLFP